MGFVATLPMYDLPEVRDATSALLTRIAGELTSAGWTVEPIITTFADHAALVKHWRDPDVALSHSCGLPFLEDLIGYNHILGTFQWKGVSDDRGHYRSVIVVRRDDTRTIDQLTGAQPIINTPESLSGWCSLGAALDEVGYSADDFPTSIASGGHSKSIELVTLGIGDFASIDGATLRLLERHRPDAVAGVRSIGLGPRVAATPLITRLNCPIPIEAVQRAITRSVADPLLANARDRLGIDRFVSLSQDDFAPITELVAKATAVLPRSSVVSS
jgi:ABC-type phosphate/phosphonate transport system substrate-binding protein